MKVYEYTAPDFEQKQFREAPDARFEEAPFDGVAPADFHAMSIFPEYFKVGGEWLLAEESRMDCVPDLLDSLRIKRVRKLLFLVLIMFLEDIDSMICLGYGMLNLNY